MNDQPYKENMTNTDIDYDHLLKQYLAICNKAIEKNKDHFPYKQLWATTEEFVENKAFDFSIYDDRPKAHYTLTLKNHQLTATASSSLNAKKPWKMTYSYLKHVVDYPDEYINHPSKLDWDWLKSKITDLE